jgi:exonuclease SbcC
MLLTRLYVRNFRVYEDELDLALPPGLVGVYGPNGAGKSTLLEAVLWTLWGKARTTKELVRSAGVGGDCVTEVEFEHEGHLYLARRTLTGINSAPRFEVRCDGLIMSEGVRDAGRYLESVLGMDDAAFRASVFAEQKQLSAFSDHSPSERQRLVLRLLGITPLDGARDAARRDSRQASADHGRLRGMLADLDALRVEAADAEAKAAAAAVAAEGERRVARAAEEAEQRLAGALAGLDRRRQEYDTLVIEGRAARQQLDSANDTMAELQAELDALTAAAAQLAPLEEAAAGLDRAERQLEPLMLANRAAANVDRIRMPREPQAPDEAVVAAGRAAAGAAGERLAGLAGQLHAAGDSVQQARLAAERSATLDGEANCPVCGQALGAAFEQVRAHRTAELQAAQERQAQLAVQAADAQEQAHDAEARLTAVVTAAETCRRARTEWEVLDGRRRDAVAALVEAWAAVLAVSPEREAVTGQGQLPDATCLDTDVVELRRRIERHRAAGADAQRLRVRLERRPTIEVALAAHRERAAHAHGRVETLRDKVRALAFDRSALEQASTAHQMALAGSQAARQTAEQAAITAAAERARHEAAVARLDEGEAQHARLAGLESESRHLARVADLLGEFRNTVVASVGPRLAAEAAQLFAELTDHEYDELQVDPETYQLQISDGGKVYGLDRFSGSEIDLANLALRVAISEHIHFQSGGSVGLMVLDEVFGPLDEDRKSRMLQALERLRGRFRQILVVTHDASIKDQLPNAIEVVKLPGRRATARPVTAYGE